MSTHLELTPQERYDIVSYRIENAQKTLGEIENLIALKYYNTAANRMYYACYYAVCALLNTIRRPSFFRGRLLLFSPFKGGRGIGRVLPQVTTYVKYIGI